MSIGGAGSGPTMGLPPVVVEVILLRVSARDRACLQYRACRSGLSSSVTPDELALRIWLGAGSGTSVSVVHSTSWRFEAGLGVVLTYAALPDPDPEADAVELVSPTVVCSEDPRRPQPQGLHGHHVAAHAVRHLNDLAGRDPTVAAAARAEEHAELWEQIHRAAQRVPTLTFRDAHPLPIHAHM